MIKIKCDLCDGTGKYWMAPDVTCKTCESKGYLLINSPTTEKIEWWLRINGRHGGNFGKWLLFVNKNKIDETWQMIRQDTLDKNLGVSSKVSTQKGWVANGMQKNYVICCYTPEKKKSIDRVRERLRQLGFTEPIGYKTNEATANGSKELLYKE